MGNKKWLALGMTGILAVSLFLVGAESGSLTEHQVAQKAAFERLMDSGIISGDSSGNLNLDQNITRAQFAKIIALAFGLKPQPIQKSSFSDVDIKSWAAGYIEAAKKLAQTNGFELGLGNGKFDPNKPLTTIESLVFIEKFLGVKVDKGTAADSNWIKDSIAAAIKAKLIKAEQSKDFLTKKNATRGFVFELSDNVFLNYDLPSGETIYEKFHSDTVDSVADEVYSEDGAGLAP
ncbi:S-layer homology domain-containing protein [Cohnella luojiensis]|uniref:S-layer homology domain-containing protein n=1 Tax=Cohnella luojiensis TaxID=652876 RepID=A0A4Y8M1H9_9BACL|nr:S-layer homology domain-containing protein [Cohnella luojiensis]TFE28957.1 S-layer homology domain-containing protein [Cohnella luojiensis]